MTFLECIVFGVLQIRSYERMEAREYRNALLIPNSSRLPFPANMPISSNKRVLHLSSPDGLPSPKYSRDFGGMNSDGTSLLQQIGQLSLLGLQVRVAADMLLSDEDVRDGALGRYFLKRILDSGAIVCDAQRTH
jgi:hypothetical protein